MERIHAIFLDCNYHSSHGEIDFIDFLCTSRLGTFQREMGKVIVESENIQRVHVMYLILCYSEKDLENKFPNVINYFQLLVAIILKVFLQVKGQDA